MRSKNLRFYDGYEGNDSLEHEYFEILKSAGFDDENSNLFASIKAWLDRNHTSFEDYVPNENYDNDFFLKLKELGVGPELALKLASIKLQMKKENI